MRDAWHGRAIEIDAAEDGSQMATPPGHFLSALIVNEQQCRRISCKSYLVVANKADKARFARVSYFMRSRQGAVERGTLLNRAMLALASSEMPRLGAACASRSPSQ